jgi:hypothetical protein
MADQLVLSPSLELSPTDFVAAWNADPAYRTLAELRLSFAEIKGFDPSLLNIAIEIVTAIGTSVVINVVSSATYDLIRKLLEKKGR